MGGFRWITALAAIVLVLLGKISVATSRDSSNWQKLYARGGIDTESGDIATNFISGLLSNVTAVLNNPALAEKGGLKCTQSLTITTPYAKYQGYFNATTGLNYWRG
jgi:hypothetical protein